MSRICEDNACDKWNNSQASPNPEQDQHDDNDHNDTTLLTRNESAEGLLVESDSDEEDGPFVNGNNAYLNRRKRVEDSCNSSMLSLGSTYSGISVSDISDSALDQLGGIFDSLRMDDMKNCDFRKQPAS